MQQQSKNIKYLHFLFSQILYSLPDRTDEKFDIVSARKLIVILKTSEDILKDIFIISNVKELNMLAKYLIFINKKIETGIIRFDNLMQNLKEDRKFIESEIVIIFSGASVQTGDQTSELAEDDEKIVTLDLKFKVEEIEHEMVSEEFIESAESDDNEKFEHNYLDIKERGEIPGDYYGEQTEETSYKQNENTESEFIGSEDNSETESLSRDQDEFKIKKVITETKKSIEKVIKTSAEDSSDVILNKKIIEFETRLYNLNGKLRKDLSSLADKILLESINDDQSSLIIKRIIETGTKMQTESEKLSFKLISEIFAGIEKYFSTRINSRNEINLDSVKTLKSSLDAIESLVSGEDFLKHEDLLKKLDTINRIKPEDKMPASEKEKIFEPEKTKQKSQDEKDITAITGKPESSKMLQRTIVDLENLFLKLSEIEGEFQNYEGLRYLSSSFVIFKKMISIANRENLPKLAQLSEASYIFIKFLQNYRMNPFEKAVKEIYNYIVYNFKLIYLDKPTKDLDTFISYLNDPVKIFTIKQKKKKRQ